MDAPLDVERRRRRGWRAGLCAGLVVRSSRRNSLMSEGLAMTPDRIPFGFDLDADGVTLRRNESEQRALAIVADLRGRGMTLRAIAEELEKRGIPTKAASHAKA